MDISLKPEQQHAMEVLLNLNRHGVYPVAMIDAAEEPGLGGIREDEDDHWR